MTLSRRRCWISDAEQQQRSFRCLLLLFLLLFLPIRRDGQCKPVREAFGYFFPVPSVFLVTAGHALQWFFLPSHAGKALDEFVKHQLLR